MRPTGICEIVRIIICKTVLFIIKSDVLEAAGSLQLCAGHEAGCEAAIHSICCIFQDVMTGAAYASSAFNFLNCNIALLNIHQLCPSHATRVTNTY